MTVGVADFEMLKLACGPILITTVPVLLPGLVSVVPVGAAMVAVLTTAPAVPATACKTTVSVLATGSVAVPLKADVVVTRLVSVAPLRPALDTKVSVRMLAGKMSCSVALVTALGPVFTNVRVKVVVWPSASDGVLATLLADRSALGPITTVAVEILLVRVESLALLGANTVARLVGAPLAAAVALTKTVSVWLTGMVTVPVKVDPVMLLAVRVVAAFEPLALTKVSVPSPAGKPSTTVAAVACAGPLLLMVRVNVVVWPIDKLVGLAILLMAKSVCGRQR